MFSGLKDPPNSYINQPYENSNQQPFGPYDNLKHQSGPSWEYSTQPYSTVQLYPNEQVNQRITQPISNSLPPTYERKDNSNNFDSSNSLAHCSPNNQTVLRPTAIVNCQTNSGACCNHPSRLSHAWNIQSDSNRYICNSTLVNDVSKFQQDSNCSTKFRTLNKFEKSVAGGSVTNATEEDNSLKKPIGSEVIENSILPVTDVLSTCKSNSKDPCRECNDCLSNCRLYSQHIASDCSNLNNSSEDLPHDMAGKDSNHFLSHHVGNVPSVQSCQQWSSTICPPGDMWLQPGHTNVWMHPETVRIPNNGISSNFWLDRNSSQSYPDMFQQKSRRYMQEYYQENRTKDDFVRYHTLQNKYVENVGRYRSNLPKAIEDNPLEFNDVNCNQHLQKKPIFNSFQGCADGKYFPNDMPPFATRTKNPSERFNSGANIKELNQCSTYPVYMPHQPMPFVPHQNYPRKYLNSNQVDDAGIINSKFSSHSHNKGPEIFTTGIAQPPARYSSHITYAQSKISRSNNEYAHPYNDPLRCFPEGSVNSRMPPYFNGVHSVNGPVNMTNKQYKHHSGTNELVPERSDKYDSTNQDMSGRNLQGGSIGNRVVPDYLKTKSHFAEGQTIGHRLNTSNSSDTSYLMFREHSSLQKYGDRTDDLRNLQPYGKNLDFQYSRDDYRYTYNQENLVNRKQPPIRNVTPTFPEGICGDGNFPYEENYVNRPIKKRKTRHKDEKDMKKLQCKRGPSTVLDVRQFLATWDEETADISSPRPYISGNNDETCVYEVEMENGKSVSSPQVSVEPSSSITEALISEPTEEAGESTSSPNETELPKHVSVLAAIPTLDIISGSSPSHLTNSNSNEILPRASEILHEKSPVKEAITFSEDKIDISHQDLNSEISSKQSLVTNDISNFVNAIINKVPEENSNVNIDTEHKSTEILKKLTSPSVEASDSNIVSHSPMPTCKKNEEIPITEIKSEVKSPAEDFQEIACGVLCTCCDCNVPLECTSDSPNDKENAELTLDDLATCAYENLTESSEALVTTIKAKDKNLSTIQADCSLSLDPSSKYENSSTLLENSLTVINCSKSLDKEIVISNCDSISSSCRDIDDETSKSVNINLDDNPNTALSNDSGYITPESVKTTPGVTDCSDSADCAGLKFPSSNESTVLPSEIIPDCNDKIGLLSKVKLSLSIKGTANSDNCNKVSDFVKGNQVDKENTCIHSLNELDNYSSSEDHDLASTTIVNSFSSLLCNSPDVPISNHLEEQIEIVSPVTIDSTMSTEKVNDVSSEVKPFLEGKAYDCKLIQESEVIDKLTFNELIPDSQNDSVIKENLISDLSGSVKNNISCFKTIADSGSNLDSDIKECQPFFENKLTSSVISEDTKQEAVVKTNICKTVEVNDRCGNADVVDSEIEEKKDVVFLHDLDQQVTVQENFLQETALPGVIKEKSCKNETGNILELGSDNFCSENEVSENSNSINLVSPSLDTSILGLSAQASLMDVCKSPVQKERRDSSDDNISLITDDKVQQTSGNLEAEVSCDNAKSANDVNKFEDNINNSSRENSPTYCTQYQSNILELGCTDNGEHYESKDSVKLVDNALLVENDCSDCNDKFSETKVDLESPFSPRVEKSSIQSAHSASGIVNFHSTANEASPDVLGKVNIKLEENAELEKTDSNGCNIHLCEPKLNPKDSFATCEKKSHLQSAHSPSGIVNFCCTGNKTAEGIESKVTEQFEDSAVLLKTDRQGYDDKVCEATSTSEDPSNSNELLNNTLIANIGQEGSLYVNNHQSVTPNLDSEAMKQSCSSYEKSESLCSDDLPELVEKSSTLDNSEPSSGSAISNNFPASGELCPNSSEICNDYKCKSKKENIKSLNICFSDVFCGTPEMDASEYEKEEIVCSDIVIPATANCDPDIAAPGDNMTCDLNVDEDMPHLEIHSEIIPSNSDCLEMPCLEVMSENTCSTSDLTDKLQEDVSLEKQTFHITESYVSTIKHRSSIIPEVTTLFNMKTRAHCELDALTLKPDQNNCKIFSSDSESENQNGSLCETDMLYCTNSVGIQAETADASNKEKQERFKTEPISEISEIIDAQSDEFSIPCTPHENITSCEERSPNVTLQFGKSFEVSCEHSFTENSMNKEPECLKLDNSYQSFSEIKHVNSKTIDPFSIDNTEILPSDSVSNWPYLEEEVFAETPPVYTDANLSSPEQQIFNNDQTCDKEEISDLPTDLVCRLSWEKIFALNEGNSNKEQNHLEKDKRKWKSIKKLRKIKKSQIIQAIKKQAKLSSPIESDNASSDDTLELGPPKIEVRLPPNSVVECGPKIWQVVDDSNGNSNGTWYCTKEDNNNYVLRQEHSGNLSENSDDAVPVVVVQRLILKRRMKDDDDGKSTKIGLNVQEHNEKVISATATENENEKKGIGSHTEGKNDEISHDNSFENESVVYKMSKTAEHERPNTSDIKSTLPRVIIKRMGNGNTNYKSYLCSSESQKFHWQPVVRLERNKNLDSLVLKYIKNNFAYSHISNDSQNEKKEGGTYSCNIVVNEDSRDTRLIFQRDSKDVNEPKLDILKSVTGLKLDSTCINDVNPFASQTNCIYQAVSETKAIEENFGCGKYVESEMHVEEKYPHSSSLHMKDLLNKNLLLMDDQEDIENRKDVKQSLKNSENNSFWDEEKPKNFKRKQSSECKSSGWGKRKKKKHSLKIQSENPVSCSNNNNNSNSSTGDDNSSSDFSENILECHACSIVLSDSEEMNNHVRQHSYHCQRCHLAFKSEEEFVSHLSSTHPSTKEQHHCLLCERTFPTQTKHQLHLSSRMHRHMEVSQRRTIHMIFTLLTGSRCPGIAPLTEDEVERLQWFPSEPGAVHFYHQATPLQVAVQDWIVRHQSSSKENENSGSDDST